MRTSGRDLVPLEQRPGVVANTKEEEEEVAAGAVNEECRTQTEATAALAVVKAPCFQASWNILKESGLEAREAVSNGDKLEGVEEIVVVVVLPSLRGGRL